MAVRTKPIRESQKKEMENAVAQRYALLKEKGTPRSDIEKDSVLKHLRAELRRANRRLFRIGFIEQLAARVVSVGHGLARRIRYGKRAVLRIVGR